MRSQCLAQQRAAHAVSGEACKTVCRVAITSRRCLQQRHAGACATPYAAKTSLRVAASAEAAADTEVAVAPAAEDTAAAAAAVAPAAQPDEQSQASKQRRGSKTRKPSSKRSSGKGEDEEFERAIVVVDKPVTHSIVRRLAEVPQAVLRASRPDDITTYKAVAAVAAAQKQLSQAGKVAVYVPYTKASRFTAQLVTADATITDSITTEPLTVKANTDAAALGNTLAFALLRDGGATVGSAGAAATAKAAEAMRVARALLIKKGFEIGVVPKFAESVGSNGDQLTIIRQEVIVKDLPAPGVVAPSSPQKPLEPTAAAAATLLARQRRCTLKVRMGQLGRLTELLYRSAHYRLLVPLPNSTPTGAAAAAAADEARPDAAAAAAREPVEVADRDPRQTQRQRLLLVSYSGVSVPPQASSSSSSKAGSAATPEQPADAATAAAADSSAADAAPTKAAAAAAAAAAAGPDVPYNALVTLDLSRSRFSIVPEPRFGLAGPDGPAFARKPVVATADSSMPGLASALESKLIKFGAAWLYSDGTTAGNRTAWEAYVTLGNKLADKQGKSSLLALVKVDQDTHHGTAQGGAEAATAGKQQQQQAQQEAGAAEGQQAEAGEGGQQQQQKGKKGKQGAVPSGYSLGMLVVLDDDVPRSIMQAPNAPLESSKVGFKQALALIKFTAAVNSFMPVSQEAGTGGVVLLPAVLPASSPAGPTNGSSSSSRRTQEDDLAVDYRFRDGGSSSGGSKGQSAYDYYFRVQRYTQLELPGGLTGPDVQQLRISPTTDPTKLRDAIVAKMLTGQPSTLRFAVPAGTLPGVVLSVGMTAVAAARVRLQSKMSAVDVGVMPLVLSDDGEKDSDGKERGGRGSPRVIYSLRLVPMPAAVADAAQV